MTASQGSPPQVCGPPDTPLEEPFDPKRAGSAAWGLISSAENKTRPQVTSNDVVFTVSLLPEKRESAAKT
jgi:hypothetical protein